MVRTQLVRRYRLVLGCFVAALVVSGLTAFPLQWELRVLTRLAGIPAGADPAALTGLQHWLATVRQGLDATYAAYPFMAYGTDWLAFGHLVIALFFIAPLRRPGEHDDVLVVGLIACALVLPLALVCGPLRGIPFGWRLIDCSFGVIGALPLLYCRHLGRRIRALGDATGTPLQG
jgi:hypothetical protein